MKQHKLYNIIFIAILIVVAGFLRLFQLGNVPHGFTNDEIVAVYNAYSLWQTHGFDASGNFLPLNFHAAGNDLTPAPIYITSMFVGILGLNPLLARLPYALAGIGSVVILYFLVKKLANNNAIAFFSSFVFAFSPWHLLISRGAWESGIALCFYLLGLYIFVMKAEKGNILWSLPAFFLAFYSYNADKIFFLPFLFYLLWFYRKNLLQRKKELALFITTIVLIGVSFFIVLKTENVSRTDILLWENASVKNTVIKDVNFQREKSSAPEKIQSVFSNKPLVYGKTAINTYLSFFSPQYLFLYGDSDKANGYGLFFWGQLYLIEIVFLLFGFYFAATKISRIAFFIFLTGLLFSPLPSALTFTNEGNYIFRSSMAIPFLSFFIGVGMYQVCLFLQKKSQFMQLSLCGIIIIFYCFFIAKYLYSYYFQFATFGAEAWSVSSRVLTEYTVTHLTRPIFIASNDRELEMQYAFFTKLQPVVLQQLWDKKRTNTGNVTFVADCHAIEGLGKRVPKHALLVSPQVNLQNCFPTKNLVYQISDSLEPLRVIWQVHEN